MNWVNQIITAVEASGKVAWSLLFSCAAVLTLQHFFPESFNGLPEWVFPTIRIVTIFTLVLSVASILPPLLKTIFAIWRFLNTPIRTRLIRKKLLHLHIFEVALLSRALVQQDRTIWAKPDMATIISLQDSGLIRSFWCGVVTGDGTSSFEIPKDVWRVLISMEEFKISDPAKLLALLSPHQHHSEAEISAALPQSHPSVRSYIASQALLKQNKSS